MITVDAGYPDILLKKGSPNVDLIRLLKERLNYHGLGPLDEKNIIFGNQTEAAVRQFQRNKLLNPDGVVGPLTWHRLFNERSPVIIGASTLALRALEIAKSQLYVREKTGKNDGKEVEAYLRSVDLPPGYAWCVAFGYWCFDTAANELSIPNPMFRTAGVLRLWNNTPVSRRVTDPQPGDVGIMDFGGGKGHFFIVEERIKTKVATVEGNTAADPTNKAEDRDGQGVFERLRPISATKGFLRY